MISKNLDGSGLYLDKVYIDLDHRFTKMGLRQRESRYNQRQPETVRRPSEFEFKNVEDRGDPLSLIRRVIKVSSGS